MKIGYVWAQFWHAKRKKDPSFRIKPAIDILQRIGGLGFGAEVLSLGCRNRIEPDLLARAGFNVTACDLFPLARGVQYCDMHRLSFKGATFDAVLASHCLEHAYDPDRAVSEVARVLKPGGLLWAAWPTGFTPNAHDRVDYHDAEHFSMMFPREHEILWRDDQPTESRMLLKVE